MNENSFPSLAKNARTDLRSAGRNFFCNSANDSSGKAVTSAWNGAVYGKNASTSLSTSSMLVVFFFSGVGSSIHAQTISARCDGLPLQITSSAHASAGYVTPGSFDDDDVDDDDNEDVDIGDRADEREDAL